ncbi:MAG: tRNA pseudouridine synthase A [Melioribacteraceae bacterium]|nr:MAG: tRNA pseudouridine synthase A [Melioribacteraceae bacterium]
MLNYKMTIRYDGKKYAGWQKQLNAPTVQGELENALRICLRESVSITGSGRTDSGVHALGQVANFRIEEELDLFRVKHSINALVPDDIAVIKIEEVKEDFHSRFDAVNRAYIYLFSRNKSPFYKDYSWYNPEVFGYDIATMNKISETLCGEHDFTSFSRKNEEQENKFCIIKDIHWKVTGDRLLFYISGNRFLHGMVRAVIGTLLKVHKGTNPEEKLHSILGQKDRSAASQSVPAHGLFLYKVRYK